MSTARSSSKKQSTTPFAVVATGQISKDESRTITSGRASKVSRREPKSRSGCTCLIESRRPLRTTFLARFGSLISRKDEHTISRRMPHELSAYFCFE